MERRVQRERGGLKHRASERAERSGNTSGNTTQQHTCSAGRRRTQAHHRGAGSPPYLVVRLEGTNVEAGKKILADSGLALEPADSLAEAAEKVVQLAAQSA